MVRRTTTTGTPTRTLLTTQDMINTLVICPQHVENTVDRNMMTGGFRQIMETANLAMQESMRQLYGPDHQHVTDRAAMGTTINFNRLSRIAIDAAQRSRFR